MIRLITFAIGAVLAILISYYFIKYAIKFFKWLFDKCKLIKPIKINWKYYSRKKVRLRKEDNDVDELKRTVDDIIRESERINYTEKLEEIENFQQKMK